MEFIFSFFFSLVGLPFCSLHCDFLALLFMFLMTCCILVGNVNTTFLYRSNKYAVTLPALLLARHKEGRIESIPLANTHGQNIVQIVTNASLETFVSIFCNKDGIWKSRSKREYFHTWFSSFCWHRPWCFVSSRFFWLLCFIVHSCIQL